MEPFLAMYIEPFLVCVPQIRQEGSFYASRYTHFSQPRQNQFSTNRRRILVAKTKDWGHNTGFLIVERSW
jgi:hypothetical protein